MAYNSVLYSLTIVLIIFYDAQTFVTSNIHLNDPRVASDPFHEDPVPYPEQEHCDDIVARKLCGAGSSEGEWAVVKVTPLSRSRYSACDLNRNFCHPFSYIPEVCRKILMKIIYYPEDDSITLQTFAYNNRTKSTIHFANNVKLMEKYYAIYQGKPACAYMEEFFDNHHHDLISPIPRFIMDTQGEMFAKIGRSEENKWMIFQNCNTMGTYAVHTFYEFISNRIFVTWVVVDADTKIKDLPLYEREYMAELRALGIDINCMVNVPIEDASGNSFMECMSNLDTIV